MTHLNEMRTRVQNSRKDPDQHQADEGTAPAARVGWGLNGGGLVLGKPACSSKYRAVSGQPAVQ